MLGALRKLFAKEKAGKAKSPISDFLGVSSKLLMASLLNASPKYSMA
jgi:hypothetical protein